MKKIIGIIAIFVCLISFTSCQRNFKYTLEYNLVYPDTTYARTYSFNGDSNGRYELWKGNGDAKFLTVFPTGVFGDNIAKMPAQVGGDIVVTDYKVFRYGVDIERTKKNKTK